MPKTIKTRSGRVLQLPTPEEDAIVTAAANADPDAVPLTDAEWETVKPLVRRGRPLGSGTKTQVTLRLDVDVLEKFKACLLYTSPSPRDRTRSRMPSSA